MEIITETCEIFHKLIFHAYTLSLDPRFPYALGNYTCYGILTPRPLYACVPSKYFRTSFRCSFSDIRAFASGMVGPHLVNCKHTKVIIVSDVALLITYSLYSVLTSYIGIYSSKNIRHASKLSATTTVLVKPNFIVMIITRRLPHTPLTLSNYSNIRVNASHVSIKLLMVRCCWTNR